MTIKQPPIGQINGRGERIKATESHFGMTCLDVNGGQAPQPASSRKGPEYGEEISMDAYKELFSNGGDG